MKPSRFNFKRKLLLAWARHALRGHDFCIVSNNCWGAHVYQTLERPYQTPFVGLFLMPDDYLNLLENFHELIRQPLRFKNESRHEAVNRYRSENHQSYPIAELAPEVEIHFLHYASEPEVVDKWTRRVARMVSLENQKLFFKLCDRDGLTEKHPERFAALPFQNKVVFSAMPRPGHPQVVWVRECVGECVPDGLALSKISHHYFDTVDWLRGGIGKPGWKSVL